MSGDLRIGTGRLVLPAAEPDGTSNSQGSRKRPSHLTLSSLFSLFPQPSLPLPALLSLPIRMPQLALLALPAFIALPSLIAPFAAAQPSATPWNQPPNALSSPSSTTPSMTPSSPPWITLLSHPQTAPPSQLTNTPPSRPPSRLPSSPPARFQSSPLAGTTWQLVALQSMDDAIGRRIPPDPAAYSLRFGADGTADLRLDCNRGRAPWQATTAPPSSAPPSSARPSQGAAPKDVSGSLRFGPLALTRALCQPRSLSNTVARQLPFVRSFLLRHNHLYLSLMADGGILEWQPLQGIPYRAVLRPEERQAILAGLDAANRRELARGPQQNRVVVARLDLNADGREELFAYGMGPLFCGTGGCTLQLFTPGPDSRAGARAASGADAATGAGPGEGTGAGGWRLVQTVPITRLPLIVAPTTTRGWRDLWRPEAGGGAPSSLVRERFDGQRYRPSERRAPQPAPEGTAVMVGDPVLADGAPL